MNLSGYTKLDFVKDVLCITPVIDIELFSLNKDNTLDYRGKLYSVVLSSHIDITEDDFNVAANSTDTYIWLNRNNFYRNNATNQLTVIL